MIDEVLAAEDPVAALIDAGLDLAFSSPAAQGVGCSADESASLLSVKRLDHVLV